jgi:hypothetical protein
MSKINNTTIIKKKQLTADDIEKLNLNQQQKLTELGAQLALKKKKEQDKLKKYNDLKNDLKKKYVNDDLSNKFSFNDENKKIREFLELNDYYFKKMNEDKEKLIEHTETLEEEQENSINELEELEEENKKKNKYWKERVTKLRHKCIYKNKIIFYLQILLISLNLITYDITINGYNSYFILSLNNVLNTFYELITYILINLFDGSYFITEKTFTLLVFIFTFIFNMCSELFSIFLSYIFQSDEL